MTVFVMLDETDARGFAFGQTVVNADAITRIVPEGPAHCRLLLNSCVTANRDGTLTPWEWERCQLFVAGTLQQVQLRLNMSAS
ncbi:hypothetical protein PUH89_06225 [Rhodobacter capsulatus]|uniref:Uncharacterized protein n=1 Tax=Rhodobacter capsulatus TaxID=1061 RepID=A0A1G7LZC5_RHOCA|nr:hypothetical protein [Rhodobacter capsulatus]WER10571.1 hypothetical protein PUH89_06225 [Rhodobacter capsulatus]SDF54270.1 hypothetical protein SAMN04244550_02427 [Rhodobacter capsulatus]